MPWAEDRAYPLEVADSCGVTSVFFGICFRWSGVTSHLLLVESRDSLQKVKVLQCKASALCFECVRRHSLQCL